MKPWETRHGAINLIDQMVSAQLGIIPQATGDLNHDRFWGASVFVYHYSDYCYACHMGGNSARETLHTKESYESLAETHKDRICAYRAGNRIFAENLFKGEV